MNVKPSELLAELERSGLADGRNIQPVVIVGEVEHSPYSRLAVPCGKYNNSTALAAKYSWVWCQPGEQSLLRITRAMVGNDDPINYRTVTVRIATSRHGIAFTELSRANLAAIGGPEVGRNVSSEIIAARGDNNNPGTGFGIYEIPPLEQREILLPRGGISLYGNDPGGVPGLYVSGGLVNNAISLMVCGFESALPPK